MCDGIKVESDKRFYAFRDAAACDTAAAAKMLADDPSLIDVRSSLGETAMHYLAVENVQDAVQWLIDRGANVNTRNDFGATPLADAASLGYLELCELLQARGAVIEAFDKNGESAISRAAQSGQQAVMEMLLGRLPPDVDINAYFDDVSSEMTLKRGDAIADLLTSRGLKGYWERHASNDPRGGD